MGQCFAASARDGVEEESSRLFAKSWWSALHSWFETQNKYLAVERRV